MAQDSKRIPSVPCPGDPHNCELLLSSQEAYRERFGKAVATDLAAAHGGTLTAVSPPGRGAVFTLTLPAT